MLAYKAPEEVPEPFNPADEPYGFSRRALELTVEYSTPPIPETYALWYAYVSRSNPQVVEIVEGLLARGTPISQYDVNEIYEAHLSRQTETERQRSLQNEFDKELTDVLSVIEKSSSSSQAFTQHLGKIEAMEENAAMPGELKVAVSALVHESARFRSVTQELTDSLERSREQIDQLQRSLEEIKLEAELDALTRVTNRRGFDAELAREHARAEAGEASYCLAMCDIDHFKRINDTHGHSVGDIVLKAFAAILKQNVKGRDTVARYGGEEFAIILPGTELIQAHNLMVGIKDRVNKTGIVVRKSGERLGAVTASFGVCRYMPGMSVADMIDRADRKLYEAKHAGRNTVRTYGLG